MHKEVVKIGGSFILDDLFEIAVLERLGSAVHLSIRALHGGTPRIRHIAPRPASVEKNLARYQRKQGRLARGKDLNGRRHDSRVDKNA